MNETTMSRVEMVKEAVRLLLEAAPAVRHLQLTVERYGEQLEVEVMTASPANYQEATDWVRAWGCGSRQKQIQGDALTRVSGEVDGVMFAAIGCGLPPSCRQEEYVEHVRKVETVDTGEFIAVKRTRVVCGEGAGEVAGATGAAETADATVS